MLCAGGACCADVVECLCDDDAETRVLAAAIAKLACLILVGSEPIAAASDRLERCPSM